MCSLFLAIDCPRYDNSKFDLLASIIHLVFHSTNVLLWSGQNHDVDATSMTGSTGSVQPSPRFDRRDHGSLQNLPGGNGGSVGVVGFSSTTTAPLRSSALGIAGPTKTNSFPTDLYDTPSSHQAAMGKTATTIAEGWYSTPPPAPSSLRQEAAGPESGNSGGSGAIKKTSPVGWTPASKTAPTGKASPARMTQEGWTVSQAL